MRKAYFFVFSLLFSLPSFGQSNSVPADTIGVNNILDWIRADGYDSYDVLHNNSGFYYWPNHQISMQCVFLEGLQWGGLKNGEIVIGGTFYYEGNETLNDSSAYKSYSGLWKIRKDWQDVPQGELRTQLENDYNNWPVDLGAPWVDVNNDGIFTKGVDAPAFLGDEVLYTVYKPADSSRFNEVYKTEPYNVEVHETVYAFNSPDYLKDVLFKNYEIINKGGSILNDFYISYWADPDFGYANDDYVGCDSSLYLAYVFNRDTLDSWFHPENPAMGHIMLEGLKSDNKNLMMTAFNPSFKSAGFSHDPADSAEYYNMVKGLLFNGGRLINPYTEQQTSFPLNGDPVRGAGWYEGGDWPLIDFYYNSVPPAGDRRYYLSSGPIDFAPGDTQTVVIAELVAVDETNLTVINALKDLAEKVHVFYGNDFVVKEKERFVQTPSNFKLYQNYPNPFNPATKITYSIPQVQTRDFASQLVTLKVYDVLGREVAVLVNKLQLPGNYEITFNANNLPSGVYFYRLSAGDFTQTKRMLLLK